MKRWLEQQRRTRRVGLLMVSLVVAAAGLRGLTGLTPVRAETPLAHQDAVTDAASCGVYLGPIARGAGSGWTPADVTQACNDLIAAQPKTSTDLNTLVACAGSQLNSGTTAEQVVVNTCVTQYTSCTTNQSMPLGLAQVMDRAGVVSALVGAASCNVSSGGTARSCNWAGTWKGTDGDQTLTETVDPNSHVGTVTGRWAGWTSSAATNNSFRGTASGDGTHLDNGTWFNGTHGGTTDYTMAPDCNSFSGQRYECWKGNVPSDENGNKPGQDAPRSCSSGSFSPMQISYQRTSGSPTLSISAGSSTTPASASTSSTASRTTTSAASNAGGSSPSAVQCGLLQNAADPACVALRNAGGQTGGNTSTGAGSQPGGGAPAPTGPCYKEPWYAYLTPYDFSTDLGTMTEADCQAAGGASGLTLGKCIAVVGFDITGYQSSTADIGPKTPPDCWAANGTWYPPTQNQPPGGS